MTKLEITVNKNKEAYLEYKGKNLSMYMMRHGEMMTKIYLT